MKHSIAKANISDMWRALDPSVDRAFRRLELHHQLAKRSAQLSMQAELEVEKSIAANQNHLKHMTERANSTDENVHRKGYAAERIPSLEESASALSDGLKSIKIRNLSIQQTLFCIEAIVKRLSILKMLISAIPVGKSDIRNQFVDLSNSLSTYLQTCQNKASQSSNESPVNLVEKLHNLEQNALMMYIRIAKGDSTDLNAKAFDRLKSDIATISSALDLERADATSELEKWSGIAALAESDNQQLLLAVARNRTARCSEILKMTEQTLDVLNVTISLTEARTQKTKAS